MKLKKKKKPKENEQITRTSSIKNLLKNDQQPVICVTFHKIYTE